MGEIEDDAGAGGGRDDVAKLLKTFVLTGRIGIAGGAVEEDRAKRTVVPLMVTE
ncbi:hypothetical protein [Actinomadura sp. CNU-125]|uniref:hypothetical protein n=1 Tax=Actinomadura sp. CNU-125 TaxID=1904961 RepID=UPI0021CCA606|nr:hypothetical protein [Actinomadura sp. CNU-125]